MCLALPGRILAIENEPGGLPMSRVEFGQAQRDVCLVYTPEARVGDFVIVHVGFAIQLLDEEAARATLAELEKIDP